MLETQSRMSSFRVTTPNRTAFHRPIEFKAEMPHGTGFARRMAALEEGQNAVVFLTVLGLCARLPFLFLTLNASTDAWARYQIALDWLRHPAQVPSQVWLPMHFWLLGAALSFHPSELLARLFTLLLGACSVPLFWALVRRAFDSRVALYSALVFSCFGMHIAYSVTTGSEVPTVFFVVAGLYAWTRYIPEQDWRWGVLSGLMLSAACLCRYEPWVLVIVLILLTIT